MRITSRFSLFATSVLLGLSACGESQTPVSPSLAEGSAGCSYRVLYANPKYLTVPRNSTNNVAAWFIQNRGTTGITFTNETHHKSGRVIATRRTGWAPYPYTLAPGSQIDADLFFDVGGAGSGTVGMTLSSSCGSITLPNHIVTVQ
jgi:hypothetical protein